QLMQCTVGANLFANSETWAQSVGEGRVFQGCRKQDVFSRAYRDVFTAALKDPPFTRTALKHGHASLVRGIRE
ncbi:MAG: hypothetical protein WB783_00260, partial [Arenicellales bacterium]